MTLIAQPPEVSAPGITRYLVLYGSHAHGTATATSDEDWRGVYQAPNDAFLGLGKPPRVWQQKDDLTAVGGAVKWTPDTVMWELGHFCQLLLKGNPNLVGMLWAPEDCVAEVCPVITRLKSIRSAFVAKPMAYAYLGWIETELRHMPEVITPKRLSHVPRLMWELEGAMDTGNVPVRLEGWRLDYVRAVKAGGIGYDEVVRRVAERLPMLRTRAQSLDNPPTGAVQDLLLMARHGEL